jgi:hypothetical protein
VAHFFPQGSDDDTSLSPLLLTSDCSNCAFDDKTRPEAPVQTHFQMVVTPIDQVLHSGSGHIFSASEFVAL